MVACDVSQAVAQAAKANMAVLATKTIPATQVTGASTLLTISARVKSATKTKSSNVFATQIRSVARA